MKYATLVVLSVVIVASFLVVGCSKNEPSETPKTAKPPDKTTSDATKPNELQLCSKLREMHEKFMNGKLRFEEVTKLLGESTKESRTSSYEKSYTWDLEDKDGICVTCVINAGGEVTNFVWFSVSEQEERKRKENAAWEEQMALVEKTDKWWDEQQDMLRNRYVEKIRAALGLPPEVGAGGNLANGLSVDRSYCEKEFFARQYQPSSYKGVSSATEREALRKLWHNYKKDSEAIDKEYTQKTGRPPVQGPARDELRKREKEEAKTER